MEVMEFLDLPPLVSARGTVRLPGSKSISNRVLLLAALAEGTTEVRDLLQSDDTARMLEALQALGVKVESLAGEAYRVHGCAGNFPVREADLFLGNAGTAFRPLTAALALAGGSYKLSGVARMHERPIGDLVDGLRQLGADIAYLGNEGFPPLQLQPATIRSGGVVKVRGDVSSQFLTGLLMALPLTGVETTVEVVGELISKPYIEITLATMARFGVKVVREGWQRFVVPAGSRYRSPGTIFVEGDASSASYFLALGAIGGGPVRVEGVGRSSIQGDVRFAEALAQMGAVIEMGDNWIEAQAPQDGLKGISLDCNHIPDAAMTLATTALFACGPTTLTNIASWRVKETDRIVAMAKELRKLGAVVEEGQDFIRVSPLADAAGWIDVDPASLRHKSFENIWGLGDAGNTTNAKTAAAARKQAPVVAHNVLAARGAAKGQARYDGYGSCPLTVERGKIVLAEFGYGGVLKPSFPKILLDGTKPSRAAWFLKERMLPPIYWKAMLKGREWLAQPEPIKVGAAE